VIDTTNLAMEEAAGRIIDLVDDRRPSAVQARAVPEQPAGEGETA
jgi:hypothetical protein